MSSSRVKMVFSILIITIFSKLLGFLRDVFIAARYGATLETDAFVMAQTITDVLTSIIFVSLATTFIPVLSDYSIHKTKSETNKFLNVLYTICIIITSIICLVGVIYTKPIVGFFAPNYTDESLNMTIALTRILLPSTIIGVVVALNNSRLQLSNNFLIPAAIAIPWNISIILSMTYLESNIFYLAIAFVVGVSLQLVMQYPFTKRLGYRYYPNFDIKEPGLRKIGILIVPVLIGSGIQEVNTIVDRILSSSLSEGSLAALNFSSKLNAFLLGILSATITSIFYTSMSKLYSENKLADFKANLKKTINILIIIIIPASIGFSILRLPIVKLIFERGMFDHEASEMTALALNYLIIGLIGFSLRDVLSRAFYAIKNTKIAMINGSIAIGINIIVSILLVPYLGLGGIALGTSVSGIVGTLLLAISLHRKIGDFGSKNILKTLMKTLAAGIVMGGIVSVSYSWLINISNSNFISIVCSIIFGIIIYILILFLFKVEEIKFIFNVIMTRIKRN